MSDFLEHARRIAAENQAAEERRQTHEAELRTQEQADREISCQNAEKFVNIMR